MLNECGVYNIPSVPLDGAARESGTVSNQNSSFFTIRLASLSSSLGLHSVTFLGSFPSSISCPSLSLKSFFTHSSSARFDPVKSPLASGFLSRIPYSPCCNSFYQFLIHQATVAVADALTPNLTLASTPPASADIR
jgi:hypothetical protein